MKTYLAAKLHDLRVTAAHVDYVGSVTVCHDLLRQAGLDPYEQVHVVNLENGARWVTYVIPGNSRVFGLNGGGAHLGKIGDRCVVMAYRSAERFPGAKVIYCDESNQPTSEFFYDPDPDA